MVSKVDLEKELREALEGNLYDFACYLNPSYAYGDVHEKIFDELEKTEGEDLSQLTLIPRGHLKSHMIAVWCVWWITKHPDVSIVYLSAQDDLAKVQMYAIKNMLLSDNYRKLWPNMVKREEAKRDKWSELAINVDHPLRAAHSIRDYTLIIKTVKATSTGLHCDVLIYDDIVSDKNAYTEAGRKVVRDAVSSFVAIKNPGAISKAVGTLYHEKDIYQDFMAATVHKVDRETGKTLEESLQWKVIKGVVEDRGDGSGTYLWPRSMSAITKKWYGFDQTVLAEKRAEYISVGHAAQFKSQYYNDPNDVENQNVNKDRFQYYDQTKLMEVKGKWFYDGKKLSVFAGMDVAFSDDTNKRSDFTAIAVIGVDVDGYIYVLGLDMYRTTDHNVHYSKVMEMTRYWGFRSITVETNNGGKLVAKELEKAIRKDGHALTVDGKAATSHDGKKSERHAIVTEPRYNAKTILHYKGGLIQELESQVMLQRPAHDDLEDALTIAIENSKPPGRGRNHAPTQVDNVVHVANSRFGGVR